MRNRSVIFLIAVFVAYAFTSAVSAAPAQDRRSALDYFREAGDYWLEGDFKKALVPYQKAFEMEKAHRTLDKSRWRVLVENLAACYGILGREKNDFRKSKEMFEYGISKDPDYPMFYYGLACTYSEMNNMEKAIEYLKGAFERRHNLVRGQKMPTPETDSSFQRFIGNDKFIEALQGLDRS